MDTSWIDVVAGDMRLATEADVETIGRYVSDEPAFVDDFVDLVRTVLQVGEQTNELGLRIGSWQIDLTKTLVRGTLTSALVAALMDVDGLIKMGVAAFAAVLPSIIEIDRISLSPGDEMLLAEVRLTHAAGRGFVTVDTLYDELPDDVRSSVNRYDFADTIERMRAVGHVESGVFDAHVLVIPDGEVRRVSFS